MASRKVDFALAVRSSISSFAQAADRLAYLDQIYQDSGYNAGGSDPITDADLTGHDITATDLANISTFATQLTLFLNNGSPIQYDYKVYINKLRSMS